MSAGMCPQVYIASPLGFAASTRAYNVTVVSAVSQAGWEVLDPWQDHGGAFAAALSSAGDVADAEVRRAAFAELDMMAGRKNHQMLDQAHAVLAVLDGTDVDSGTASEIGYAAGRGLPIVGLRTDVRQSGENEGCTVNLQVEYFIRLNGGTIVATLDEAVACLIAAVSGAEDRTS